MNAGFLARTARSQVSSEAGAEVFDVEPGSDFIKGLGGTPSLNGMCSMYDVMACPTEVAYPEPGDGTGLPPERDPWLLTDPAAIALYFQHDCLGQLYDDLTTHVMRDGAWAPEEVEYHRQIEALLRSGVLAPKGTFAYLSPHAPVYRAAADGALWINQLKFGFGAGADLVFVPWPLRASRPSLRGPVWIGHLHTLANVYLCCELFPFLSRLCQRTVSVLQTTLTASQPS